MRQIILIVFLIISTVTCFAQTLFFDNFKNSTWTSDKYFNITSIRLAKEIGLYKLRHTRDSIKTDRTIWKFKDDLTISYYDSKLLHDSILATYKYEIDKDNNLLKIYSNNETLKYEIGIVSTGSYAHLIRKKK